MPTPATIPFTAAQPKTSPQPQPWSPDSRDRLIFQWVKFDGHQQSWVAEQLGIDQSTVCRTVQRYERWIARGGPAQQGAPNQDERLRAQRWLAYERNEWILSSALRLAAEMERPLDTTASTVLHPRHDPGQQSKVRTEYKAIDRSGLAARFLRLAHRINMDQLQLVEQEPLPALDPLTTADLADDLPPPLEERRCEDFETDFSDATSVAGWHGPSARVDRDNQVSPDEKSSNAPFGLVATLEAAPPPPMPPDSAGWHGPSARVDRDNQVSPDEKSSNSPFGLVATLETAPPLPVPSDSAVWHGPSARVDREQTAEDQLSPALSFLSPDSCSLPPDTHTVSILELTPNAPPLHKTHNPSPSASTLTASHQTPSAESPPSQNSLAPAYAVALHSPASSNRRIPLSREAAKE